MLLVNIEYKHPHYLIDCGIYSSEAITQAAQIHWGMPETENRLLLDDISVATTVALNEVRWMNEQSPWNQQDHTLDHILEDIGDNSNTLAGFRSLQQLCHQKAAK